LQKLIDNRHEAFNTAWQGGKAYCEASAKAGEEWEKIRPGPGGDRTEQSKKIDAASAGFASRQDAMTCDCVHPWCN
jgi:hypothetical protein